MEVEMMVYILILISREDIMFEKVDYVVTKFQSKEEFLHLDLIQIHFQVTIFSHMVTLILLSQNVRQL